jgi:uncharacterized protein YjbI with pentapeptide repeats
VQTNALLQQISATPVSEPVQQQIEKLKEFQLDEHLARNALTCFHKSELAQALNQLLSTQLQQAGMDQNEAQIVAAWVAWGTHRYLKKALEDAEDSVRQSAELYMSGRQQERDKYGSIDAYLRDQIAAKPLEKVFAESFTFRDIYVPLNAQPVDKNGNVHNWTGAFDLEAWAKSVLNDSNKQAQVMFIEGGPGRGKSVFCRMFADWVRQHLHPTWTPILIRLRDIRNFEKSIENTLRAAVKADFARSDNGWLTDRNTRFLFLLDGFDELLMERRTSEGLKEFLQQVGQFQRDCKQSQEMGHRVLITGRSLALQSIEWLMPSNMERVEIVPMDDELQQQWFRRWEALIGTDKTSAFQQFLQDQRCPERVRELAQEPLLLYLLAAMHRDGELTVEMFEGVGGTRAKILIYEQSLEWVLTKQRPAWLMRELTQQDTDDLRRILTEAGLCVVQSGGECASVTMIEERLKGDNTAKALLEEARKRIGDNPLRNALAAFYLQPAAGDKEGAVEFAHKSFGEFLCAQQLKESLENWTQPGRRGRGLNVPDEQMHWEIYDLLGYGGLTPEILEYLMALLDTSDEFKPVQLFGRLEDFYLRWCEGEYIDIPEETLPQKKTRQLQKQGIELGQRQVDVYAGLNVMILLLELHRYARSRNQIKNQIIFYPCGQKDTEGFDELRLLRIISYSHSVSIAAFLKTVGQFLSGADLSRVNLSRATLSGANLSSADLSGANLSDADLSDADLSEIDFRGANLSDADLSRANLSDADLSRANLSDIDLGGANLSDADLSGANLSNADLHDTNFSSANLSRANLRGADLNRANLSNADLSSAVLSGTDFRSAVLSGVKFCRANLIGANFIEANLTAANLTRADLTGADLTGANLTGANLSRAELSDANLSSANLKNILWDKEYTKWENIRRVETAKNLPESLKQQLGL